jgi:hypothetical protein
MVRSLTLILSGALFVTTLRAELQLTPKVVEYKADGATLKHLEFSDAGKTITYQSPRGWDFTGSSTQLTLRPRDKTQVEATISRVALSQPANFDEESLKKLVGEAVMLVPRGGEKVTVVSQEKNSVLIQGRETFLITLSYMFFGQEYRRSILFLNRGNEQIRSQLTCRAADFDQLHSAFLHSQLSWQNL